jgi:hypothetical protein
MTRIIEKNTDAKVRVIAAYSEGIFKYPIDWNASLDSDLIFLTAELRGGV